MNKSGNPRKKKKNNNNNNKTQLKSNPMLTFPISKHRESHLEPR